MHSIFRYITFTVFIFCSSVFSFKSLFNKDRYNLLLLDKKPDDNLPEILNIDFEKLINQFDKLELEKIGKTIPQPPQTEYDIEKDSFEGYLLSHFNVIKNTSNQIDFEGFLSWRKQIGTLLTTEEIYNIYNHVNKGERFCGIMNFITVNKIIDELDGADF